MWASALIALLAVPSAVATVPILTAQIVPPQPAPYGMRPPLTYENCYDLLENGRFEAPTLLPWSSTGSNQYCNVIKNTGLPFSPLNSNNLQVNLAPIANTADATTVPAQGMVLPFCQLTQNVTKNIGINNTILKAQLSWVDRITSQGNVLNPIDQNAQLKVWVDNGVSGVENKIFETNNTNTNTGSVRTFQRVADVTALVAGMTIGGILKAAITLEEVAVQWPLYFQLDNVEFWVCTTDVPPDPIDEGDPHLMNWKGMKYDYNGACDQVFLHSDMFADGLGIDIHVRNKHRRDFAYIANAAVRIGSEILEVSGSGHFLNGVSGADLSEGISGFPIKYKKVNDKSTNYIIDMHGDGKIVIKTWKDFVSIKIEHGSPAYFGDSVGLLGNFYTGDLLARDGVTNLSNDINTFGQEWMVAPNEPVLFQTLEKNEICKLPPPKTEKRRRLGASITEEAAAKACEHVGAEDREFCIYDVLATNDFDMAGAY